MDILIEKMMISHGVLSCLTFRQAKCEATDHWSIHPKGVTKGGTGETQWGAKVVRGVPSSSRLNLIQRISAVQRWKKGLDHFPVQWSFRTTSHGVSVSHGGSFQHIASKDGSTLHVLNIFQCIYIYIYVCTWVWCKSPDHHLKFNNPQVEVCFEGCCYWNLSSLSYHISYPQIIDNHPLNKYHHYNIAMKCMIYQLNGYIYEMVIQKKWGCSFQQIRYIHVYCEVRDIRTAMNILFTFI